ncbi:MAG: glutamate-cysteine ligase family protein [Acidimicrobiales bacterium]
MSEDHPPLTRREVVEHLQAHDTAPSSGPVQVGIEQEWHTYCLADPGRHLHPEEVLGAVSAVGELPCGSTVTVEPGGQVELATPPAAPWWTAIDALRGDGAVVREALAVAGISVLGAGTDPFREPTRTLSKPRYDAMEAYFDQWAPAGRLMMNSCASIQVNIDHGPADAVARRWDLAHRIGPALGAAFACSPSRTHRSARLAAWHQIDPTRTSPAYLSGDLCDDWPAYVLAARLMLLHEDDDRCEPVLAPITFGEWLEHGIDGRRPTQADLDYHCTTLFPPVRPRGWLELRWLDSLPAGLAETATAAIVAVLVDEDAGDRAARACASVATAWDDAARLGPAHPDLAVAATTVLRDAADAIGRSGAPGTMAEAVADAADRWPARGRCPADDLEDRMRRGATVVDLSEPPAEVVRWS